MCLAFSSLDNSLKASAISADFLPAPAFRQTLSRFVKRGWHSVSGYRNYRFDSTACNQARCCLDQFFRLAFLQRRLLQLPVGKLNIGKALFFMFFVHTSLVIHAESPACSLKSLRASGGLDGIDAGFCGAPGRCA